MMIRSISIMLVFVVSLPLLAAKPARRVAYEPPLGISAGSSVNLLLNAKTSASGQWSDRAPGLAVNGDRRPEDHWACENLPVWHQVDLAAATDISSLRVIPFWGDGRVYQYKVEGSADGKNWSLLGDMTANSITGTAEGNVFNFPAVKILHLRTTFLNNSRGAANGGHLAEIEAYASAPNKALGGGIGSTDLRYPPSGSIEGLGAPSTGIRLHAWRNERVSAQLVLRSDAAHQALRFDPLVLRNGSTSIPATARFVRYTLADEKPVGDILDDATRLDLPAGANRPVWIEINVPANVPPGNYDGIFTARSNSSHLDFPVSLEVLPATLPDPGKWAFHLDLWQHPDVVARFHDVPLWSDAHLALLKPSMIRLAQAGQKTITTTLIHEAWGGQTYDRFGAMIEWRKEADGTWSYDYSIFDRWVSFMSEQCGFAEARIHGYSMIPWSLSFRYYDEATQAYIDIKLQPGSDEYDAFWGSFLRDFKGHLKAKGWLERMRIGVDERPDRLMRGALATLAKHAPEIRVASAINHPTDLTRNVDDISPVISHAADVPRAMLDERRAAGQVTTFYVCNQPPIPNNYTFSPPAESEWLPLFAAANGFDGFLRWAYHSWSENPLFSTDFPIGPSGDAFLIYPGDRSSIRFERLRQGIESFEKIRLLREFAMKNPSSQTAAALAKIDAVLADFTWPRGKESGIHADDVKRINAAILDATRTLVSQK